MMTTTTLEATAEPADFATAGAADYAALAGRILLAAIFLLSGVAKITSPGATIGYIASAGLPLPTVAYVGSLGVELGAGLLLITGIRARAAASVLAAFCVLTGLAFHHAFGDQDQFVHFWKNIAITGGLLQVAAFGGGRFRLWR